MLAPAFLFCLTAGNATFGDEITTFYQDSNPKYIASNGRIYGLCMDIIKAVEDVANLSVVNTGLPASPFRPLKRIILDVANGNIDVFFCLARNTSREALFDYVSTPLYEVNHRVAVRSGEYTDVETLDDIRALGTATVLTNFGTATERFLMKQRGIEIDASASTLTANLQKLLLGRGEFVYFHDIGLYSTIRQNFSDKKIDVLPASFRSYHHYLVVSKNAPTDLKDRLEKAVAVLEANGTLGAIIKKYKTTERNGDAS